MCIRNKGYFVTFYLYVISRKCIYIQNVNILNNWDSLKYQNVN